MTRRATWVWTRPDPDILTTWSSAHRVTELFVGVDSRRASAGDLAWVTAVRKAAHARRISVSALGGDPAWCDDPGAALRWARGVTATGVFDGLHLDLEPWARPDWDRRRSALVAGYLEALRGVAGLGALPLEADLAFWLHEVPTASGSSLQSAAMQLLDAATVLTYRTTATGPDSISAVGASALDAAARARIPCRLAAETRYLGAAPDQRKQTFYGARPGVMESVLVAVDARGAGTSAYAGIAVHDYDGWMILATNET